MDNEQSGMIADMLCMVLLIISAIFAKELGFSGVSVAALCGFSVSFLVSAAVSHADIRKKELALLLIVFTGCISFFLYLFSIIY